MKQSEQFTAKAKSAIERARRAAMDLGSVNVGTEHLLLGVAGEQDSLGAKLLRDSGFSELRLREEVRRQAAKRQVVPTVGLSVNGRDAIRRGGEDARRLGHLYVGTEHILLGILRMPECTGARVITALGGDLNKV